MTIRWPLATVRWPRGRQIHLPTVVQPQQVDVRGPKPRNNGCCGDPTSKRWLRDRTDLEGTHGDSGQLALVLEVSGPLLRRDGHRVLDMPRQRQPRHLRERELPSLY